jgi:predicted ester cyclase
VDEIVIFRLRDGKIAEAWEVYDEAGTLRQLGVAPPG